MNNADIWRGKLVLAVDDEEDVLLTIQDEFTHCPGVTVHAAPTFEKAMEYLVSYTYDLIVLDIVGVRGLDLLEVAIYHKFPVVMLTAHAVNPDAFKKSIELGARAYLSKDQLSLLVLLLEDVMRMRDRSVWKRALDQVAVRFAAIMRRTTLRPSHESWRSS